jgi:hypothetical protein
MPAARARCMKARWSSRVACDHYVLRGQVIISHDGGRTWICRPCALAAMRGAGERDGDGEHAQ